MVSIVELKIKAEGKRELSSFILQGTRSDRKDKFTFLIFYSFIYFFFVHRVPLNQKFTNQSFNVNLNRLPFSAKNFHNVYILHFVVFHQPPKLTGQLHLLIFLLGYSTWWTVICDNLFLPTQKKRDLQVFSPDIRNKFNSTLKKKNS